MEHHPQISIIIPNYNRGDLLRETLDSLLKQDSDAWEAIVVDDGSTDDSRAVAKHYADRDPRIRLIVRDRDPRGAPVCRNIGIERSKGDFLIFLDSDDLLTPYSVSQRLETIRQYPDHDFWVFPILMFRDDPAKAATLWNIDDGQPDLHRFLILDAPWQTSGPVWRKSAVERIGGFTEGLACWQDVDFHIKALIAGLKGEKFYNLPPDVLYRQHEIQSISQGEISSPAKLESRFDIFRRHALALKNDPAPAGNDPVQIMEDLRLLGGNIAIGAAKVLNAGICTKVIRFGSTEGIFPGETATRLIRYLFFYLLRMNKIPALDRKMKSATLKYRRDSNIGKHPYRQSG